MFLNISGSRNLQKGAISGPRNLQMVERSYILIDVGSVQDITKRLINILPALMQGTSFTILQLTFLHYKYVSKV